MSLRRRQDRSAAIASPLPRRGPVIEQSLKAKALAALFGAGASLALLVVALPHSEQANEMALVVIAFEAYLVALVLYERSELASSWVLPVTLAAGTVLFTGVAYFSGEHPSPLIFFYLWIFLYAAYFFSPWQAMLQIGFVGLSFGGLLVASPPPDGAVQWWAVGMGSLAVAAVLVVVMRGKMETLIGELYESARTDPLTGLPNRRGFRHALDLEIERAKRSHSSVSVVMGDVDHFKVVNDRSGHPAGDDVLQRLGKTLTDQKRMNDFAARIGGEEFGVILADSDAEEAYAMAERVRQEVQREFADDRVPVTISFGIATYPETAATAAALLVAGDEALYAAKQNGRNRSVIHSARLRAATGSDLGRRDIESERYLAAVLELAQVVDLRFSGTARHSETVGRYAELMAAELGLSQRRIERVRLAGVLHDVGKVGVPDAVLNKREQLDDAEWELIRRHPQLGADILEHPHLADVRDWVLCHHERPDGRGYPRGLAGDELPLEARILAVADAYEAMTSDRTYRSSLGNERARAELRRCSGSQFDERVVEAFLDALDAEAERSERRAVVSA